MFYVLDKGTKDDFAFFDLDMTKHGHFLNRHGNIEEVHGVRMSVPLLDVNPKTLFQIAIFLDDMGESEHSVTIVLKETDEVYKTVAKMGVFSI